MKVKIFERLNECLRKGYLKAGMQHNIFAQIFASICQKLRLDSEIQSHSVDFRQCELADYIYIYICIYTVSHKSEYTPHISAIDLVYLVVPEGSLF